MSWEQFTYKFHKYATNVVPLQNFLCSIPTDLDMRKVRLYHALSRALSSVEQLLTGALSFRSSIGTIKSFWAEWNSSNWATSSRQTGSVACGRAWASCTRGRYAAPLEAVGARCVLNYSLVLSPIQERYCVVRGGRLEYWEVGTLIRRRLFQH